MNRTHGRSAHGALRGPAVMPGPGLHRDDSLRIMVIYGTRPEAIKVAPLIRALEQSPGASPG